MLKFCLGILFMFITSFCNGQVLFTEKVILGDADNYSEAVFEKASIMIDETDNTYIIKSDGKVIMELERDKQSFHLSGREYDIISLDANTFGYCSSEMVKSNDGTRYKLQYRHYSKSKDKWENYYDLFFLFKYGDNNFPTGDRIVYKRWTK